MVRRNLMGTEHEILMVEMVKDGRGLGTKASIVRT